MLNLYLYAWLVSSPHICYAFSTQHLKLVILFPDYTAFLLLTLTVYVIEISRFLYLFSLSKQRNFFPFERWYVRHRKAVWSGKRIPNLRYYVKNEPSQRTKTSGRTVCLLDFCHSGKLLSNAIFVVDPTNLRFISDKYWISDVLCSKHHSLLSQAFSSWLELLLFFFFFKA